MKKMNNTKRAFMAKIMGGMIMGMTALAGMAPITAFAQSKEVTCTCEENAVMEQSMRTVNYACMITLSARVRMHMWKVMRNAQKQRSRPVRRVSDLSHRMAT